MIILMKFQLNPFILPAHTFYLPAGTKMASESSISLQTAAATAGKTGFKISKMAENVFKTGVVPNNLQQIDSNKLNSGFYGLRLSNGSSIKFQN